MNLNKVKIHPVNESFIVYLPKKWVEYMGLEKGDEVKWFIEENDFKTLKLNKVV
jgi:bifunctional DNA-binding transcriptional regulator/antitoxin component of YhaV-PrlF toxin-antitoxin module